MIVTMRSSSSEVSSPALECDCQYGSLAVQLNGDFHLPLVEINICLFAHQIRISPSNTLDFGQGVHNLLFSFHTC